MATLASLTVNLLAQTGRFTQPIQQAARTVERFDRQAERMQNTLRQVEGATSAARSRLLAMSAAVAVATKQATAYAGAITAVHQQTGLAIESVQGLRYAAQQSNTDIKTLEMGLRSLVRRAAEAEQGNESFAKGFRRLGVDVRDAHGRLKDTETLLMDIADGAANMATEAEASAALMLVMGDAGRRLVPFMRQGADGIRGWMDEAVRMGIVAEEHVVVALDTLGARLTTTGNRFGAISRDIAYRFSPAINVALGWVNQLIDGFFDLSAEQRQQIVRWTAIVGAVLGGVAVIGVLARVLSSAIGIMRTFGTVLQFVFSPLVLYTALAIGALALFKTAWDGDWLEIQTRTRAAVNYINEQLDRLLDWWETSDIGQAVREWWAEVETIWTSDELTLPQKSLETVTVTVGAVAGLIDSILQWWGLEPLNLQDRTVELIRLNVERISGLIDDIKVLWADEELTLPQKTLETVRLTVGAVLGLTESIADWFLNVSLDLARNVAVALGVDWENSRLGQLVDQVQDWWNNEDITLAEKALGVVAVAASVRWVLSFAQSFASAVASRAALSSAMGAGIARLGMSIGSVAVWGSIVWMLLPTELKEEVKQLWAGVAESIRAYNVAEDGSVKNPFLDGVASWLANLPVDGWQLPALTIGASVAGFHLIGGISALASKFGGWLAGKLMAHGLAISLAVLGIAAIYEIAMDQPVMQQFVADLQAIWDDEEITLSIKVAKVALKFLELPGTLTEALYEGFLDVVGIPDEHWLRGLLSLPEMSEEALEQARQGRADSRVQALQLRAQELADTIENLWGEIPAAELASLAAGLTDMNREIERLGGTAVKINIPSRSVSIDDPIVVPGVLNIENVLGLDGLEDILDAIYVAEGGSSARVPYGATGFFDAGHRFSMEKNQQRFDEMVRALDLVEGTDDYYRAAAATTVMHYWDTFARDFPEVADRTFAELAPDIQAAFIRHLGQFYAPVEAHALNQNWTPNVLRGLGLAGFARGGYTGDAPVDRVVGVVHGQELVIPAPAVRRGLEGILEWLGVPGFQSGTPVMIDSGLGYAVSPGTTSIDVGFLRAQFETAMRWIEQSISPELADTLRQSFEGLLDVTDMLERELKVLWEAIDSVPEALDDALASARDFGDGLDELLASEQERQDRLQRMANNVNAALSGFASGLGESQQLLARFIQTLRYDAESGFGFDTASLIQMGASVIGWLFGGQGQQERHEARQFAAPDPLGMGGLLAARAEQQRLEAMIPSLERAVKNAQGFVDHMAGQWWNPSQQHRAAEALRVASEELSSAQQALAAFDFRGHLGIDAPSIARAVESGLDLADTTRLGASLESTIRDALTRAWVASDEMLRLQNKFGDMLEGIVTEYMETGIVGDLGELRAVIAAIEERGEAFADVLRELGLAADDVTDSLGGMLNIPRGFKYALERVEAATARPVPANVTPAPVATVHPRTSPDVYAGAGLSSGSSERPIIIQGDVYGWDDFKRKVQQASDEAKRDGSLASYGFAGGGS